MLKFKPKYLSKPWGGRRLESDLGRLLPDGKIGESWELAELPSHQSLVHTGPRKGQTFFVWGPLEALGPPAGGSP